MSSETLQRIDRARALKLFAGGIIVIHVIWIAFHAWLVSHDRINVWRLGGYAMYTIPPPFTQVHVATRGAGDGWEGQGEAFRIFQFYEGNYLNIFRCMAPPEQAMKGFFGDNPQAIGEDLRIQLSEHYMERDPFVVGRRIYATIVMDWTAEDTVAWTHDACGELERGTFTLAAAG